MKLPSAAPDLVNRASDRPASLRAWAQKLIQPDYRHHEGVRPIQVYVLRLFFALIFTLIGFGAWQRILTHEGPWDPIQAVSWCTWAAYATFCGFGVYNTLRMLPILLFIVLYKAIWLLVVAYPLWQAGTLRGPAEELAYAFSWILVPALFIPWKYVFSRYILTKK